MKAKSPPAQKAGPRPMSTTTFDFSFARRRTAVENSFAISSDMALSASGRSNARVETLPSVRQLTRGIGGLYK